MSDLIPKVLALPVGRDGCSWYRIRQIMRKMNDLEIAKTHIVDEKVDRERVGELIENADVVIARNSPAHAEIVRLTLREHPDKRIVFDHDDNTFLIQPSNEHYRDHGIVDVTDDVSGTELWKTGQEGFDAYKNRKTRVDLEYLLENSTLNTSPIERLSDLWGTYNGNSAVIPNCINFDWYPDVEVVDPEKKGLRIGWQGGASHAGDFREIGPVIAKVMKKHKDTEYHSLGAFWEYFFKGVEDRCVIYPWTAFEAHPLRTKLIGLDIAVIPLEDEEFNYFKSEIKFSEFSALKIPCLVKDQDPYAPFLRDEENCLVYKTEEEFEKQLERLIKDPELRKKLAQTAYDDTKKRRNLDKWAPKMLEIYLNG